jgi:phosphatidylserine/phosphatidylglycerophosphate/cardiolipin synthase-like enzyme
MIIVDDAKSLTGGRNIAVEYFVPPAPDKRAFLDADIRIDDVGIARQVHEIFESELAVSQALTIHAEKIDLDDRSEELLATYRALRAWLSDEPLGEKLRAAIGAANLEQLESASHLRGALHDRKNRDIRAEVRLLDSRVRLAEANDVISEGLQRLVRSTRHNIVVVTPYLVLSPQVVALLRDAAARGVTITIVTNSPVSSDNAISQAFFLNQWPQVLAEVSTLRLFVRADGHNMHAKTATFDEQLALVGTYNLDPLSMAVNSELVAASWSPELARTLDHDVQRLIEAGPPVIRRYRIERNAAGEPQLGNDGRPKVAFGPRDHSSPEEWSRVELYWNLLRAANKLPGFDPIF